MQRTLAESVSIEGVGYWSGETIRLVLKPAAVNTGIVFRRVDLPGKPFIPVHVAHRKNISLRTSLVKSAFNKENLNNPCVEMVEHVIAALVGMRVDNCEIQATSAEMPAMDGSCLPLTEAIEKVGVHEQNYERIVYFVDDVICVGDENAYVEVRPIETNYCAATDLPSEDHSYPWTRSCSEERRLAEARFRTEALACAGDAEGGLCKEVPGSIYSYELDFGPNAVIERQCFTWDSSIDSFTENLAPARTFLREQDAKVLRSRGIGTHVGPEQLLVFGEDGVIGNELRFDNECARHKTLDMVGDFGLIGCDVVGHFVSRRGGHALNALMVKELLLRIANVPCIAFSDEELGILGGIAPVFV